eukprot:9723637-Heterocapsa_arctica.AAC.1
MTLRRKPRNVKNVHKRHLALGDSMTAILALQKGRASHFGLLSICRRQLALCVAGDGQPYWRWLASELNPADWASRRFEREAIKRKAS